jgi:hypothetical protein
MLTLAILCLALDSLPPTEADRVLRLHVEAAGGEAALRRITSRRSEGSLERHGRGVPIVTLQRAPNLVHVETRFPRPGTLRQGFDGGTAWVLHPLQGGRLLDAGESAAFASQAWLHPSLHLVVVRFEDYREVDGIVIPFTVRTRVPLFETVLRLDRVEHNVALDEGLFQKPF